MSAIGLLPPREAAKLFISSHADYRREDFMFARTQSSAMREMPWARRTRPLQSWDRLVYATAGCLLLAVAALALLY